MFAANAGHFDQGMSYNILMVLREGNRRKQLTLIFGMSPNSDKNKSETFGRNWWENIWLSSVTGY